MHEPSTEFSCPSHRVGKCEDELEVRPSVWLSGLSRPVHIVVWLFGYHLIWVVRMERLYPRV